MGNRHSNISTTSGMVGYEENKGDADCGDSVLPIASNGGQLLSVFVIKNRLVLT